MANSNLFESTAKSRVTQIFQFLRAFYSLKTKTILQISDQPWTQWIRDIPSHECVWVASDSDLQIARPQPLGLLDHALAGPFRPGRYQGFLGNRQPRSTPGPQVRVREGSDTHTLERRSSAAFVTVDASTEVTYQTPAVFGAEQHSPKPLFSTRRWRQRC